MKQYSTTSKEGKFILFATILASGMAFLDGSVVNIAIPAIQSAFQASITGIQWVVNSYALLLCALILISGALGDRFGRKKIFIYGIFIFILSSFLCSVANSITQLAIFRGIQGIGGAMMVPGSLSIINVAFNESVRGKAIGLWSGYAGGVSALGPFLGGWLVQVFGWPSIFYINIPLGLLALLITIRYVPETKNNEATTIDVIGAVLIFLSLLAIVFGLISGTDLGWNNPLIIVSLVLGILLFTLFIITEKHVKEPLVPFEIFKSSLVSGANITTFFLYFALSGVTFFLVLNLQQIQHFSPILAGLAMLPAILLITFFSGVGGTLADKIGPRIPMIVGPFIVSVGMALFIFTGKHANYFLEFLPGLILFGIGMSLVIAPLTKSALAVDHKFSGAASGVNNAVARVAGLLAVAILGAIVFSFFSIQLTNTIQTSRMMQAEKQQIIQQKARMGAITIPLSFPESSRTTAQKAVEDSFIYGFRWAMALNALLAFISAVISFFMIHDKKVKN